MALVPKRIHLLKYCDRDERYANLIYESNLDPESSAMSNAYSLKVNLFEIIEALMQDRFDWTGLSTDSSTKRLTTSLAQQFGLEKLWVEGPFCGPFDSDMDFVDIYWTKKHNIIAAFWARVLDWIEHHMELEYFVDLRHGVLCALLTYMPIDDIANLVCSYMKNV